MSGISTTLRVLKLTNEAFAPNYANLTAVRWARKPIWMGTAKSKIFRVPKRPVIPIEEKLEIQRLYNNYRTTIKSIKKYLASKYSLDAIQTADPEQEKRIFEEDFARCMAINNEWNAKQTILREKQAEERLAQAIAEAKTHIVLEQEIKESKVQKIEEIVRTEKEKSKDFITEENIDAAIEKALSMVVDYNYAIDLEGNFIQGRETTPEMKQDKVK